MKTDVRTISCDVLIIGSGSAGMWCAKELKTLDKDVDVLIADKAGSSWGGLMSLSGGDLEVCLPEENPDDWIRDFVYYWDGLCQQDALTEIWRESYEVFEEYIRLGCRYLKDENGGFRRVKQRGLEHIKLCPVQVKGTGGSDMRRCMLSEMERLGVRRIERVQITDLIKSGAQITGAAGFNAVTGEPLIFEAGAVVLATGNASFKPAYCQNTAGGEGFSLAYQAGAVLRNFEFLNIWNVPKDFEWEGQTVLMPLGAKFVNALGESFMEKYSPVYGPNTDPHYITRAMTTEILQGRGPIYLDLSAISPKDQPIIKPSAGRHLMHYNKLLELGTDFFRDKFEWIPQVQMACGGIETQSDGSTAVDGLFAAGRARSLDAGVYMGGFALTTTAVTGRIAARSALRHLGSRREPMDTAPAIDALRKSMSPLGQEGIAPHELLYKLQQIITCYDVSILKNHQALSLAMDKLQALRNEQLPRMAARDAHELMKLREVLSIADVLDFYLHSAIFRTESRAGHFRADYPERDPDWLAWTALSRGSDGIELQKRPVPVEDYDIPVDRFYADCFTF